MTLVMSKNHRNDKLKELIHKVNFKANPKLLIWTYLNIKDKGLFSESTISKNKYIKRQVNYGQSNL